MRKQFGKPIRGMGLLFHDTPGNLRASLSPNWIAERAALGRDVYNLIQDVSRTKFDGQVIVYSDF
jgi:hypothetical protein